MCTQRIPKPRGPPVDFRILKQSVTPMLCGVHYLTLIIWNLQSPLCHSLFQYLSSVGLMAKRYLTIQFNNKTMHWEVMNYCKVTKHDTLFADLQA